MGSRRGREGVEEKGEGVGGGDRGVGGEERGSRRGRSGKETMLDREHRCILSEIHSSMVSRTLVSFVPAAGSCILFPAIPRAACTSTSTLEPVAIGCAPLPSLQLRKCRCFYPHNFNQSHDT